MSWGMVAVAAATVVTGVIASNDAKDAANKQEAAATSQLELSQQIQDKLQKRTDEAITDIEAAEAEANGLITKSEADLIRALNQGTNNYLSSLEELKGQVNQDERQILEDMGASGALSRQELEEGILGKIGEDGGFSGGAIEELSPFNEAGQRALRQIQFRSNLLTPEERDQFKQDFGVDGEFLPPSQSQRVAEEALLRRQRAAGKSQGGLGFEEFGRLGAEEETRQFNRLTGISNKGQEAAKDIAGLRERLSQNLFSQRELESQRKQNVQLAGAASRLGLGEAQAQQGLTSDLRRGDIQAQTSQNLAQIAREGATQRANIGIGSAIQGGNLGLKGAELASQAQQQAAALRLAGRQALLQGITSGVGAVAGSGLFNNQNQNQNTGGPPA